MQTPLNVTNASEQTVCVGVFVCVCLSVRVFVCVCASVCACVRVCL